MPDEKKSWWELKGWNEREKVRLEQLKSGGPIKIRTAGLSWFNPECTHERCSYDILTCEKCKEYSKQKNEEHAKQTTTSSTT